MLVHNHTEWQSKKSIRFIDLLNGDFICVALHYYSRFNDFCYGLPPEIYQQIMCCMECFASKRVASQQPNGMRKDEVMAQEFLVALIKFKLRFLGERIFLANELLDEWQSRQLNGSAHQRFIQ